MKYEPTWNSLKRHRRPEWLDDAKFGIYFHWGPYSVPGYGTEWYPHFMYRGAIYGTKRFHKKNFGDIKDFGYKDFIPLFKAENFNAEEWIKLFKDAGAKFAGPVAEHSDGFSMWDSKVNRWNAAKMGPKRDVVGELEKAVRKHGLKFVTTFHHGVNWYYFNHSPKWDTGDPKYADLYGPAHEHGDNPMESTYGLDLCYARMYDSPNKTFLDFWIAKLKEVVNQYEPDLIWFDYGLERIHDKYKREFAAYYYNKAEEWGREVEIIYKGHHLPPGVGMTDYERGRVNTLTYYKWMTDTSIGIKSWSYLEKEEYKPISSIIHNFIDQIAKNGTLLLNIGPKANGDLPHEVVSRLKELGKWIKINKEAIYNTTPWVIAEEGPTEAEAYDGSFSEKNEVNYSAEDLRFVTKDNALYVYSLGWPGRELLIKSLIKPPISKTVTWPPVFQFVQESDIQSIELLGHDGKLSWSISNKGLVVELPSTKPCEHAYAFKITWT